MESQNATDKVGQKLRSITGDIKRYIEKRIELMMLNSGEYFSKWIAISVHRSAGVMLLMGGVCFVLLAVAIYLDNVLGIPGLGFVIVSIPLFIFGVLFMYLKPTRLFEELQERFETELIEAVEQNGKENHKQIEAPEIGNSFTKEN